MQSSNQAVSDPLDHRTGRKQPQYVLNLNWPLGSPRQDSMGQYNTQVVTPQALTSVCSGPPLHGESENRLPWLGQGLHQKNSETSALRPNSGNQTSVVPTLKLRAWVHPNCPPGRPQGTSTRRCMSEMPSETERARAMAKVCNSKQALIEGV